MKLLVSLLIALHSFAFSETAKFRLDDPPFYTMTFEEIQDVPARHKETYFKRLLQLLRQLKPSYGQKMTWITSTEALEELSREKDRWNKLRAETFQTCQSAKNGKICDELLDARRKIFYTNAGSHEGTYGSGER